MAQTPDMINHLVWRIATLSPLAQHRLETEDYRHHLLVDEDTPEEQLYELLKSLLGDLEEIGITYGETIETILETDEIANGFLDVLEYIFPANLYLRLREDNVLRTGLYHVLDGSSLNTDLLDDWLDYLCRYDPRYYNHFQFFRPRLVGSGLFNDYLEGLSVHIREQHILPYLPVGRLQVIDKFISRLKTGHARITAEPNAQNLDMSYATDLITQIEHLCSDPSFAIEFGAWLEMSYADLPEPQKPYYTKLSRRIMTSIPMSRDYIEARDKLEIIPKELLTWWVLLGWATRNYPVSDYITDNRIDPSINPKTYQEWIEGRLNNE